MMIMIIMTDLFRSEHDEGVAGTDGVKTQIESSEPVHHCRVEDILQVEAHKLRPGIQIQRSGYLMIIIIDITCFHW